MLVGDGTVEGEPVHLVVVSYLTDLSHHDLDLIRLGGLSEDRSQSLRVGVRKVSDSDVATVERVAPQVG